MARRKFIAGNWKMNLGPSQAERLAIELKAGLSGLEGLDLAVAPVAVSIPAVAARLKHTGVHVAGQNLHPAAEGAFTGELSGEMLREAGCTYVLVGHSERRALFGEDDAFIHQKVLAALRAGLLPILCVGETLPQRQAGQVEAVLDTQLRAGLGALLPDQVATLTLAYEPVWAIGTGVNASPEQAQAAHAYIRAWLRARYPAWVADALRVQYGGSVKASNAAALLSQPDVDGALVGGASLKASEFLGIARAALGLTT